MSNDLILEVEESLRQERLNELWKEYGGYLIAGCVLAVLFTALFVGWKGWNEKVAIAQTAMIVEAITMEDPQQAAPALEELSNQLTGGRKAVALLSAAGWYLDNDKIDEAMGIYQTMQADSQMSQTFRDFAVLLETRAIWDNASEEADESSNPTALLDKLAVVRNNIKSPWHYHALLQSATIAASGNQDYDKALEYLTIVNEAFDVPTSLKDRSQALSHIYKLTAEKNSAANQPTNSNSGS